MPRARLGNRDAAGEPQVATGAQGIRIEAHVLPDTAGPAAPVAQMDGYTIVGMTRHEPDRSVHDLLVLAQLDYVFVAEVEPLGRGGTDQHGIVPSDRGQRPRQLLQPAVVGKAAVPDRRVGTEG